MEVFKHSESEGESSEVVREPSSVVVEEQEPETELTAIVEEKPKTVEQPLELSGMLDRTRTVAPGTKQIEKDPYIGRRVGEFTLTERLGEGGFGVVYKAENNGTVVALKKAREKLGEGAVKTLLREAAVTKRLKHPSIVCVEDIVQDNGNMYVKMPYVDAKQLDVSAERTVNDCLNIVHNVGKALEYAHSQKVVHQDVKPGNVLVNEKGEVFIVDFGLARAKHEQEIKRSGADTQRSVTFSGPIGGTLDYMSPEQRKGENVDHRADIYGLSVLLYKLLTKGQSPAGSVEEELVEQGISEKLAKIVAKGMAQKKKRWSSMDEFLTELLEQNEFLGKKVEGTEGWHIASYKEKTHLKYNVEGFPCLRIGYENPSKLYIMGWDSRLRSHFAVLGSIDGKDIRASKTLHDYENRLMTLPEKIEYAGVEVDLKDNINMLLDAAAKKANSKENPGILKRMGKAIKKFLDDLQSHDTLDW
ncbi:serine/threonine protein kinase [Candidatus Woesearchaeota archaeon]|nr:serine/threonine protein kinase [Candidatus Woesearchaeota archaeon]